MMVEQATSRILVVDDEPDMCWALWNCLHLAGFAVTTATSSAQALELLARESYDVAFVDAKLPDVDGLELAALIHRRNPDIAIVSISGYFYPEDAAIAEEIEKGNLVGFIGKPFNLEEVRTMACRAVEQARGKRRIDGPYPGGR